MRRTSRSDLLEVLETRCGGSVFDDGLRTTVYSPSAVLSFLSSAAAAA